jgi:hypothetical protein
MLEAVRMLERGDASAEDIDTAMKLGAGELLLYLNCIENNSIVHI